MSSSGIGLLSLARYSSCIDPVPSLASCQVHLHVYRRSTLLNVRKPPLITDRKTRTTSGSSILRWNTLLPLRKSNRIRATSAAQLRHTEKSRIPWAACLRCQEGRKTQQHREVWICCWSPTAERSCKRARIVAVSFFSGTDRSELRFS